MGEPLLPWSLFDKENVLRTARLKVDPDERAAKWSPS